MARPVKYSSDDILDSAARLVSAHGPAGASVAAIARSLGAPTGSIYHRFESRDLLMAQMWIRLVRRAQSGFVEKLAQPDVRDAAYAAALHVPHWCRTHLADAKVILMYRREQLAATWPDELGAELAEINTPLRIALRDFSARLPGRSTPTKRETVAVALVDMPYATARRHVVAGMPPPASVDGLIRRVCDALLFDDVT